MRRFVIGITVILSAAAAQAQRIQIDIPPAVAAKAVETVDVTLDGALLRLAAKFLGDSGDEAVARDVIQKLEGIYVRSYQFDDVGVYDHSIVDKLRAQLGPAWKRLVAVKERRENTEIYADMRGENVIGLLVLSTEPRQLTIINLVGPIDIERLSDLEGHFGIPKATRRSKKEKSDE